MKPIEVSQIHREICQRANCEYLDKIDYSDSCAACPNGHWGRYESTGCEEPRPTFEQIKEAGERIYPPVALINPGDLLSWMIWKTTGIIACGACDQRRKQMNEWGWWNCWKNRKNITDWLIDEANKRNHKIDNATAFALFKTAFKQLCKQTKSAAH